MGSSNIERFGTVMANRMKATSSAAIPTTIELATVNSNLSITPDSLGAPIPRGDYMVNILLTGETVTSKEGHSHSGGAHEGHTAGSGTHSHSGGEHQHKMPSAYRGIQAGDRVLIAWCGNEPVVIAIVA